MMRTVVTPSAGSCGVGMGELGEGLLGGRPRLSGDERREDELDRSKEHAVQGTRVCLHIYMPVCKQGCVCMCERDKDCIYGWSKGTCMKQRMCVIGQDHVARV